MMGPCIEYSTNLSHVSSPVFDMSHSFRVDVRVLVLRRFGRSTMIKHIPGHVLVAMVRETFQR